MRIITASLIMHAQIAGWIIQFFIVGRSVSRGLLFSASIYVSRARERKSDIISPQDYISKYPLFTNFIAGRSRGAENASESEKISSRVKISEISRNETGRPVHRAAIEGAASAIIM